ncbi:hypothetical protein [Acanthopleuribacter pedis]|uniref:Uncharacterized protein n=1 Tax=Acanthopleuribacter pedis TaxID=442870 RepID=A0A8J7Q4A8_9BACT|nr:hypothetical protein [Acanthopleuribacter pedis]MBO1320317.1 hypothetical protein [Acanthopleuribacter pedis]
MWHDQLIPHIQKARRYRQQDVLDILKNLKLSRRRLPSAFLKAVGWENGNRAISGSDLIAGLQTYKPSRGRRSIAREERKSISCQVRVTEEEHRFIKFVAGIHHLSVNQYVLACIFDEPLPAPQHGLNVETSHILNHIGDDLRLIEACMRDGKIEPISVGLFTNLYSRIKQVQAALNQTVLLELDVPNLKGPRTKRLHLVFSPEDMKAITNKRKSTPLSRFFRGKVLSVINIEFIGRISKTTYKSFRFRQGELSKAAQGFLEDENINLGFVVKEILSFLEYVNSEIIEQQKSIKHALIKR